MPARAFEDPSSGQNQIQLLKCACLLHDEHCLILKQRVTSVPACLVSSMQQDCGKC